MIDYDKRLSAANKIAKREGLPLIEFNDPTPDDGVVTRHDEVRCGHCEQRIKTGGKTYSRRVSHEYDEWESYCSQACANGYNRAGLWTDFIERMGWTLYHSESFNLPLEAKLFWALPNERDWNSGEPEVLIAREGDERWEADKKWAEALAAEVACAMRQRKVIKEAA